MYPFITYKILGFLFYGSLLLFIYIILHLSPLATDSVNFIHTIPLFTTDTYIISIFFKSLVLAAAPDINHPYSRISLANTPILPKNILQLGEILQNTPLFMDQE